MRWLVGLVATAAGGVGLGMYLARGEWLPPRQWDGTGLSFDLRAEYNAGYREIVGDDEFFGKSEWGEVNQLVRRLIRERATRADRLRLVEIMASCSTDSDPTDEVLALVRPELIDSLAAEGECEAIIELLGSSCPHGGIGAPLSLALHELRQQGGCDLGLELLFRAYASGTPAGRARIREVLGYDFHHIREKEGATGDVVEWARGWYAEHKDTVIGNYEVCISGPEDTWSAPVLMPVDEWFRREMAHAEYRARSEHAPFGFGFDSWDREKYSNESPVFLAEIAAWTEGFKERAPNEWTATPVEAADGRRNVFRVDGVVCDMRIEWLGAVGEDGQWRTRRIATIPMRFRFFYSCCPQCVGEDWRTLRVALGGLAEGKSVEVRYYEPHGEQGARVAAVVAELWNELWPDENETVHEVKVYPNGAALQAFVAPNAPLDLMAHSMPGGSLKLVVNEQTSRDEIEARLRAAAKLRSK